MARGDIGQEVVERGGEIGALFFKQGKALAIPLAVCLGCGGTPHLLACVEYLEREDGETIDDQAG